MSKKKRRHFSHEEKLNIVKQVLSKAKTVTEISEEYGITPGQPLVPEETGPSMSYSPFSHFLLDGFSRSLLHWDLMTDMTGLSAELFTQKTIDKYPEARPMVIHDNGSQFISHDIKCILSENNCIDVPTRRKHPETNGKAERFVGLARTEALRLNSPAYYGEGVKVIEKFVDEYNNSRYHAGIGYLKSVDVFHGRGPAILAEKMEKLKQARQERFTRNTELNRILMGELPA